MADIIEIDGIGFAVESGPGGRTVQSPEAALEALAELANQYAAGKFGYRELADQLASQASVPLPAGSFVRRVPEAEVPPAANEAWNALTGRPLTGDVIHIFLDHGYEVPAQSWVPLSFSLALLDRARESRLSREPVWLFRAPALYWRPAPGEFTRIDALEQRVRLAGLDLPDSLVRELAAAGLFDVNFARERSQVLQDWSALRLLELQRAGSALLDYVYSAVHGTVRTPPPYGRAVEDSPVSLAVFASPTTPWPEDDRHGWLAGILKSVDRGEEPEGYRVRTTRRGNQERIEAIDRA